MNNGDELEFSMSFDRFFEVLELNEAALEKMRQDLDKAGVIKNANGQERVSLQKWAKYVLDDLSSLSMKAAMSRSHEDIVGYTFTSLAYLRVSFYSLARIGRINDRSKETVPIDVLKSWLESALEEYHKFYEHVRLALGLSLEINISANTKE